MPPHQIQNSREVFSRVSSAFGVDWPRAYMSPSCVPGRLFPPKVPCEYFAPMADQRDAVEETGGRLQAAWSSTWGEAGMQVNPQEVGGQWSTLLERCYVMKAGGRIRGPAKILVPSDFPQTDILADTKGSSLR